MIFITDHPCPDRPLVLAHRAGTVTNPPVDPSRAAESVRPTRSGCRCVAKEHGGNTGAGRRVHEQSLMVGGHACTRATWPAARGGRSRTTARSESRDRRCQRRKRGTRRRRVLSLDRCRRTVFSFLRCHLRFFLTPRVTSRPYQFTK